MNKVIILDKRPIGKPTLEDFRIDEEAIPTIKDNEVLLKTKYVSVDPWALYEWQGTSAEP